jgi:hypothetical protein
VTPWPLSVAFPLTLVGSIVLLVAFDAAGAAIANAHPAIKYRNLWPIQFGLYIVVGFIAMFAVLDLRLVQAIGAITGFVEATLGWWITWRIGPGRLPDANVVSIGIVVLSMTAFGFGFAIVGALLFNVTAAVMLHTAG